MKQFYKYFRQSNLIYLADYTGLVASCLCFIHCWTLPFLLILVPGLMNHNEWAHPVLCSIAIISTLPVVLKKTFSQQPRLIQFALASGNIIMLIILLAHDLLNFKIELLLNTIGGLSLVYVHYNNLGKKKEAN